jgi:tetratricopeptide (TPR) repeat protein
MKNDHPLWLVLNCLDCQSVVRRKVSVAYLDPCPQEIDPEWDGVFIPQLVRCDHCDAVDRYRVTPPSVAALRARANSGSGRVLVRRIRVVDADGIRRPSEGIDRIRRAIDERPNDAVLWRRLGNLYNMLNDTTAAEESWSRALEVDKAEFPSALGLAQLSASLGDGEHFTPRLIEALARIRGLPASASPTGDSAEEMADVLLELLHTYVAQFPKTALQVVWAAPEALTTTSKEAVITLSDIQLSRLGRWDRLCEFFASGLPMAATLEPGRREELSMLHRFLDSEQDLNQLFEVPKIDRPSAWVGSGKKRKPSRRRRG